MTPKEVSEADAAMAMVADTYPAMWHRMYTNLVKEGFTEPQAMAVLLTFVQAMTSSAYHA